MLKKNNKYYNFNFVKPIPSQDKGYINIRTLVMSLFIHVKKLIKMFSNVMVF